MGSTGPVLTVKEAAAWFRRSESTIWMWVSEGYLTAVGRRGRAKLYAFADLVDVERNARHRANKDLATNCKDYLPN